MGVITDKREVTGDLGAATVASATITYTTNAPTVSYTVTIADGSFVSTTEAGVLFKTVNTQIAAIITDLAAVRTLLNT
jgi:hypothetical protein